MSWNVLAHEYTRYNTPTGSTETEREKQRRWLQCSTWLQMLRPDIVCLQEVTPSFIEYLVLNYKEEKKKNLMISMNNSMQQGHIQSLEYKNQTGV